MRPELELIEKIEQYLKGEMSHTDKAAFEKQMAADPSLREEVKLQQEIMKGMERAALKQEIQTAGRSVRFQKNFMKWGIGGLSIVVVLTAAFLFYKSQASHSYAGNSLPELNEAGEKMWTYADSSIPAQHFSIDVSKDTIIETKGGIVMAVPANGFLDENGKPVSGKIDLVIKEALDPATIMKAGLSTKSGDKLLESGGMFFVDARKDKQILKIDPAKGIYTEIPADTIKPGMQLFSGKRMPNGTIDWIDPKPLEKDLLAVDIQSLDFYPPLYLDSLQQWGYDKKNKKFTDSLYYSFARLFAGASNTVTTPIINNEESLNNIYQSDTANKVKLWDGRALFTAKCASCHSVFYTQTGPPLGGVLNNDYYKGDIKKIANWVYNVNTLVETDTHYKQLHDRFRTLMQQFSPSALPEKDIKAIFDYIENKYQSGDIQEDHAAYNISCGINPAKIKAIWNKDFQNTILATREFEERLYWIHLTANPAVLDLYVNNLDKPLYYIDSLAALMAGGYRPTKPSDTLPGNIATGNPYRKQFEEFAARRDGKVKNASSQLQLLKSYYEKRSKAFTEAITKVQNEFWEKQAGLDDEATGKKAVHTIDSVKRITQNLTEELVVNLDETYRQLGYITQPGTNVYRAQITSTGAHNIDKYVVESTITRTTLNYTDPQSGKSAVIEYKSATIHIDQWSEYDHLFVYLLPDKLSSFMRMDGANGSYSEKLNGLMQYKLVCIGYKDEQAYVYSSNAIEAKDYTGIALTAIDNDELDRLLNSFGSSTQSADLKKENEFSLFDIRDQKREKHNLALLELMDKVRYLIFPCYVLMGSE